MYIHSMWNQLWRWDYKIRKDIRSMASLSFIKNSGSVAVKQEVDELESEVGDRSPDPENYTIPQRIGLFLGPVLYFIITLFLNPEGMSGEAVQMLGLISWIATWWVTEALPIPITSLLPLLLFPITGVMETGDVSTSYGDPLIFLFAGSFMIALTMEKWNLHKRIALAIIAFIGSSPNMIILGFMTATGFLSMWISNTASTMMMVPISLAVTKHIADSLKNNSDTDTSPGNFPFGTAIMLGTAYAATIGGFGTLIGAPANTILAATVNNLYGIDISFARWMLFGVPMVVLLIPLIWLYLVKIAYPMKVKKIPGGRDIIKKELKELGKMSYEEKIVLTVFSITALAWMTRSLFLQKFIPGIDDTLIALFGAFLLFLIPAKNKNGGILDWNTVLKLPWGILWLFGGGTCTSCRYRELRIR
ncbi:SLC13 family permease [Guptibacillus hwajinpoensis]|uniref:SLC13 family permease n=1 Tax=Guptibacillus hwajinpoensis TaxID=208199 RepID=UPI002106A7C7|nr:DASS family sodium-coupled anion symporter [Pseudalkalibacillus hwajinpoensis]WLR58847.1 DASS family sodium-coupled anion symporter [Pseudalkalibacillus hwajinpoensis]